MNDEKLPDLSQLSAEELRRMLAEEEARLAQITGTMPPAPIVSGQTPQRRKKHLSRKAKLLIFGIPALLVVAVLILCAVVGNSNWSGSGTAVYSQSDGQLDKSTARAVEKTVQNRIQTGFNGAVDQKKTLHFCYDDGSLKVYLDSGADIDKACALLLLKPAQLELRDDNNTILATNADLEGLYTAAADASVLASFGDVAVARLQQAAQAGSGLHIYLDGELVNRYDPGAGTAVPEWANGYQLELARFTHYNYAYAAYADLIEELPVALSTQLMGSNYSDQWSDYLFIEEIPAETAEEAVAEETPAGDDPYANLAADEFVFEGQVNADQIDPYADGYSLESFTAGSFIVRYIYNSATNTVHDVQVEISGLSVTLSQTLSGGTTRSLETTVTHTSEAFLSSGELMADGSLELALGADDRDELTLNAYGSDGFADGYISYVFHNEQNGYDLIFSFMPVLFYNITAPELLTEEDRAYIETMNAAGLY
jgi:hypothetical protein